MPLIEIYRRGKYQCDCKNIEGRTCYLECMTLKSIQVFIAVLSDAPDHVPYSDSWDHLNKRIYAKTKQGDGFIFEAEEYRDYTFDDVVKNSYQG